MRATYSANFVGATLVIGPPEGPSQSASALARALPVDRGRTVVVVDFPSADQNAFWPSVATALGGRGPVRVAVSHAGSMRPTAPGQWLADQLQTEVVAPDGVLTTVPGAAFVVGTQGYGSWLKFLPGASPMPFGRRFPVPQWEAMDPNSPWPTGEVGISEPIPAGLWLRAQQPAFDPGAPDARPIVALPCRDNVLTVVVGGPGQAPIPTDEVCRLLTALPFAARSRVRLVPYGTDTSVGRLVADQLNESIFMYTGLPVGNLRNSPGAAVVAVDPRGQQTWRPFVTEVRCSPFEEVPVVSGYRPPVQGLAEVAPGVFGLGEGVVLEVVPSGLWVRESDEPFNAAEVRSQPVDPEWARLTVGTPGRTTPGAVAVSGAALVERLEPEVRKLLRVVFCDSTVRAPEMPVFAPVPPPPPPRQEPAPPPPPPPQHSAPEPPQEEVIEWPEWRFRLDGPLAPVPLASWEVPPQTPSDREMVLPDHRSTETERDAVRRALGERYAPHAAAVCRLLAQREEGEEDPQSFEAMVTDLTALVSCLSQDEEMVTETLRMGRLGRLRPYVACIVSALSRLPLHNGVTVCWGASGPTGPKRYRTGDVLVEHGLLDTSANPAQRVDGRTEYLVWSVSGRRVEVTDRVAIATQERVIFPPGTAFRVLAVIEQEDDQPMQVMLQELAGPQADQEIAAMRPSVLSQLERAGSALRAIPRKAAVEA